MRHAASNVTYSQAVDVLAKTEVSTSIYFIIGTHMHACVLNK